MSGDDRPLLIGVTGNTLASGRISHWLEPAVATSTYYLEALDRAGATGAVLLPVELDDERADALVTVVDGVVITGGPDVDPARYGQPRAPETYRADPVSDHFELALIRAALGAGVPLLAICRGHQLVNVGHGGTLHQHITGTPGLLAHGVPNGGGGAPVEVAVEHDSTLARAIGGRSATGMCHHHQAVDQVGGGLRVVARSADGVVEALEPVTSPGWAVSVQWHPEDSAARDPQQQRIFDALVGAATARRHGLAPA